MLAISAVEKTLVKAFLPASAKEVPISRKSSDSEGAGPGGISFFSGTYISPIVPTTISSRLSSTDPRCCREACRNKGDRGVHRP